MENTETDTTESEIPPIHVPTKHPRMRIFKHKRIRIVVAYLFYNSCSRRPWRTLPRQRQLTMSLLRGCAAVAAASAALSSDPLNALPLRCTSSARAKHLGLKSSLKYPLCIFHSQTGPIRTPTLKAAEATNVTWHDSSVSRAEREKLLGQRGCVVWITGLSGSGKSTLACTLSRLLLAREKLSYVLDGDNLRHGLNKNLSFSADDRAENIRRVGEVAKLFADAGIICIASLISPYREHRDACRALLPAGDFLEVFMNIPLEICERRDPKGLYKLARAGKIKGFTGIDDVYEIPLSCEIVIEMKDGVCPSPNEMGEQLICYLEKKGII